MSSSCFSQIPNYPSHFIDGCHFEIPCSMVTIDTSVQNIWQIGRPLKIYFNSAYSPTRAIVTDTINSYPPSNHSSFILKVPNGFNDNLVSFWHKFQTDTLIDGGYIEASLNHGQTWMNVINSDTACVALYSDNLYSNSDTLQGGINGFSGTSNGWINTRILWQWVAIVKIVPDTLYLRFNFISDNIQTNKDGWIIDDIDLYYVDFPGYISKNETAGMTIIPNPCSDITTITIDDVKTNYLKIIIFNQLGQIAKIIDKIKDKKIHISRDSLERGLYFVQLLNNNDIIMTTKLIIE